MIELNLTFHWKKKTKCRLHVQIERYFPPRQRQNISNLHKDNERTGLKSSWSIPWIGRACTDEGLPAGCRAVWAIAELGATFLVFSFSFSSLVAERASDRALSAWLLETRFHRVASSSVAIPPPQSRCYIIEQFFFFFIPLLLRALPFSNDLTVKRWALGFKSFEAFFIIRFQLFVENANGANVRDVIKEKGLR